MRGSDPDLIRRLFEESQRYDFLQLTRWLLLYPARPSLTDVTQPPRIRFRGDPSLSFPLGEVSEVRDQRERNEIAVVSPVFGLFGPSGTMPHHDLELVSGRGADPNLVEFLDFFNDRWLRLLYEVWRKNRPDIALEAQLVIGRRRVPPPADTMAEPPPQDSGFPSGRWPTTADPFTQVQLALAGFPRGLRSEADTLVPPTVYAALNAYFSRPVRSGAAVQQVLTAGLGIPVQLDQFRPRRLPQPPKIRSRIGSPGSDPRPGGGAHNRLGRDLVLAPTFTEHHSRFDLQVGPLNSAQFTGFCPWGQPSNLFHRLLEMTRALVGAGLEFGLRLLVQRQAVTQACLGDCRLGYNTWIGDVHQISDRDDPYFDCRWESGTYEAESVARPD